MQCVRYRYVRLCIPDENRCKYFVKHTLEFAEYGNFKTLNWNFQRFGCALVKTGQLSLRQAQYKKDSRSIDESCECSTCKTYTRAYLHQIVTVETVSCHLLTVHNIAFQMRLMRDIRDSIKEQRFPRFIQDYMLTVYPNKDYPTWIVNALGTVNVTLL